MLYIHTPDEMRPIRLHNRYGRTGTEEEGQLVIKGERKKSATNEGPLVRWNYFVELPAAPSWGWKKPKRQTHHLKPASDHGMHVQPKRKLHLLLT